MYFFTCPVFRNWLAVFQIYESGYTRSISIDRDKKEKLEFVHKELREKLLVLPRGKHDAGETRPTQVERGSLWERTREARGRAALATADILN